MLVSVGDREADMYELFYEVMQTLDGPEFLVRSSQGRNRKVATEDDTKGLWDKMKRGETDNPGTTCMWRGLARLPGMALGYRLALDHHGLRPGP